MSDKKLKVLVIDSKKLRNARPKICSFLAKGKLMSAVRGIVDTINYVIAFVFAIEESDDVGGKGEVKVKVVGTDGSSSECSGEIRFSSASDSNVEVNVSDTGDGNVDVKIGVYYK